MTELLRPAVFANCMPSHSAAACSGSLQQRQWENALLHLYEARDTLHVGFPNHLDPRPGIHAYSAIGALGGKSEVACELSQLLT